MCIVVQAMGFSNNIRLENFLHIRQGPDQDFHFALVIFYVTKVIPHL